VRIAISIIPLALGSFVALSPAQAGPGAIGFLGFGHTFQEGEDDSFGPTLEVGGSFSVLIAAVDLTYWTDLDDAGPNSQLRLGGRITPPVIPLYGRLALGLPLDGDTRDALGADIVIGAGFEAFSLPLFSLLIELDYHQWTEGIDARPLELKAGAIIGF
jgi:hypothetical protein